MAKNIVVITGSPRKGGNSELLAKSFIEGAVSKGHNVTLFEAAKKNIRGCIACGTCFSKGYACSINDDFNEISNSIECADILALCTPLYWFSFSAQIKIIIDKMYSFHIGNRKPAIKEAILIACSANKDITKFGGLIKSYELILEILEWKDIGQLLVPNVRKAGDVLKTDGIEKAKKLGMSI